METLDIGECNVMLATGVASESYHMCIPTEGVANRDRYVCVHVYMCTCVHVYMCVWVVLLMDILMDYCS